MTLIQPFIELHFINIKFNLIERIVTALKRFNYHPVSLSVILIVFAAVMAMFMDSITVMLFLSALTLQLCRLLKLDPVPLVIAEVCAANTGGAATLVGDPPNVILGTTLGFNFADYGIGPVILADSEILIDAIIYGKFEKQGEMRKEQGKIRLTVQADELEFFIENSKAPQQPRQHHPDRSGGIGLVNVRQRLDILYPENHDLHIENEPNRYAVTMLLKL